MEQQQPPPPWVMSLGAIPCLLYGWMVHYPHMLEFQIGVQGRVQVWAPIAWIYRTLGFWLAVAVPFLIGGGLLIGGVVLTIREHRRKSQGLAPSRSYATVRWRGQLGAGLWFLVPIIFIVGLLVLSGGPHHNR